MARITYNDISVERTYNGGWRCSALVDGYYVHMIYFYYSKKEALKQFHQAVNDRNGSYNKGV